MSKRLGVSVKSQYTFPATRIPTVEELYWAAGFFEGEGCFRRTQDGGRGGQIVTAAQVNAEPLMRVQAIFGGSLRQRGPYSGNRQPHWYWVATGARARGVMLTLYRFMSARRQEQIRKAMCSDE